MRPARVTRRLARHVPDRFPSSRPAPLRRPALVVAAHGSTDARFAPSVEALASRVRSSRPEVEVRVGYLDHGPPHLGDVAGDDCVVVPLLLAHGYHTLVDVPRQAGGAVVTAALGPDPRLAAALGDRLREAGYGAGLSVVLAAAGSRDRRARADVQVAAGHLAAHLGVEVTPAYVSAGEPRLRDLRPAVVATYLLATGVFSDTIDGCGARCVARPIGAHPAVVEVVLARYDAAVASQVPGRTAPA